MDKPQLFIYKVFTDYNEMPYIGTICAHTAAEAIEELEEKYGRGSIWTYSLQATRDNIIGFSEQNPLIMDAKGKEINFNSDMDLDEEDYETYVSFVDGEVDEDGDPVVYQVECPNCGRTLYFDSVDVSEHHHLICPDCGCFIKQVELTDDDEEEENEEE